ncbi:MAG: hypothetical protein NVS3B26_18120 [Mycobacteriales bacterium]
MATCPIGGSMPGPPGAHRVRARNCTTQRIRCRDKGHGTPTDPHSSRIRRQVEGYFATPLTHAVSARGQNMTLDTTTVDRLLHHAHQVLTDGRSQRLAEALAGKGVVPLT